MNGNESLSSYASQVIAALQSRGYPAVVEYKWGIEQIPGNWTASVAEIHVPGSPARQGEQGIYGHFVYTISPNVLANLENPADTAAYIIAEIQYLSTGVWIDPLENPSWPKPLPPPPVVNYPSDLVQSLPTGTQAMPLDIQTPSGDTVTTVPITGITVSTPASGTLPTIPSGSGLLYELLSVTSANGYDPGGMYNGYQIAWIYQRTPSFTGYELGPTELGLTENATITLQEAAPRIVSYLGGTPKKAPTANGIPATTGQAATDTDWKQIALIGGMILAGIVMVRAITT